jgi:hypothetical protein
MNVSVRVWRTQLSLRVERVRKRVGLSRSSKRSEIALKNRHFMCSMMLSPNAEHLISVAPSIMRAKS